MIFRSKRQDSARIRLGRLILACELFTRQHHLTAEGKSYFVDAYLLRYFLVAIDEARKK